MTPEELEEIQGIGPEMVERSSNAVIAYYGQFEEPRRGEPARLADAGCSQPTSRRPGDEPRRGRRLSCRRRAEGASRNAAAAGRRIRASNRWKSCEDDGGWRTTDRV